MMQGFRALLASELFMRNPTNRQPSRRRGIVDWEGQNWGSNPDAKHEAINSRVTTSSRPLQMDQA